MFYYNDVKLTQLISLFVKTIRGCLKLSEPI
jgi:hypothetical protein